MGVIDTEIQRIRTTDYGEDMRDAIGDAMEILNADASGAVHFNAAQNLTAAQKQQARENIGVTAGAVRYDVTQSLTSAQKENARSNIGAVANNQGSANSGKALIVDPNGNVITGDTQISNEVKEALLACFEKVAWIDSHGQDYCNALYEALYNQSAIVSISAVYTQSGTVYDIDTLDSLKSNLVVTANLFNSTTIVIPSTDYTLSGTLTAGTSAISVTYEEKNTTFNVTVTAYWTYQWDYSMGKLDEQEEWHVINTGTTTNTMTQNGQKLEAINGSQIYIRPNEDPLRHAINNIGVIEVATVLHTVVTGKYGLKIGIGPASGGNTSSGVFAGIEDNKLCYLNNNNRVESGATVTNDIENTIRVVLNGNKGTVYLNNTMVASNIDVAGNSSVGQFYVAVQSLADGYVLLKSVKIRNGAI